MRKRTEPLLRSDDLASNCERALVAGARTQRAGTRRAVAWATRPDELAQVRARLAEGHAGAPLFDLRGFARQLEAAHRAIWRHQAEGSADRRIRVV